VPEAPLADRAYYAIRELIVSLDLRPGSVVNERELMERLELGRTPIREAVRRLAQEQLVEVFPRRGTFVTTVEIRDLASICDVRSALEAHAARIAAERASDADREEFASLIAELDRAGQNDSAQYDDRALMAFDERIHRAVYRATHNQFLVATLEEYYLLALRIWFLALEQPRELEQAVLEHRALLEAILARDGVGAERIMREHVDNFETAIRRVLLGP
jgi:DNA-binding GntR family transcriptional regulator